MTLPSGFGVNVACFRGDYPFAKACCASIRRHLGDVPIHLYIDGDFPVRALENRYGVRPIHRRDVGDPDLRARSYGYGLTKMVVLWESRFERFLYLDADTVMWGNPLEGLDLGRADFIHNDPHEPYTDFILKSQYFDYERLFEFTRPFDWRGRHYFNTGVFVARRGLFALDEYWELLDLKARDPSLLPTGEQGILNVMVFRAAAEGRIAIAEAPLQTVIPVVPRGELTRRFDVTRLGAASAGPERTVLHWAGPKPFMLQPEAFPAPMTWYRRLSLRDRRHPLRWLAPVVLWAEELSADRRLAIPPGIRATIRRMRGGITSTR